MKKVLLDTSFILTCIRQKIDFFEQLENEGLQVLIPKQVIKELESLNAELALKILEKNKAQFKEVNLKGKNTDKAIINYAKIHKDIIVATLDRELKNKIKNQKLIVRGRKKLEII